MSLFNELDNLGGVEIGKVDAVRRVGQVVIDRRFLTVVSSFAVMVVE